MSRERPTPLSGFPEWLPGERLAEQQVVDHLRRTFELAGFAPLETRAVEPLDQLLRKGEIDKEVYVVRRLHEEDRGGRPDPDAGPDADDADPLALHFDLTVPFARYVLENAGKLEFPFRRYQIQKVWRGERPQEGRYREFIQADIDIVGRDTLPFHHDVEIAQVMAEALSGLPVPPITLQLNNRRLIQGFYEGLGVDDVAAVMRAVDKLDKIGPAGVRAILVGPEALSDAVADACLRLAEIATPDASFVTQVQALGVRSELLDTGLAELAEVVEGAAAAASPRVTVLADLRIARGLDYYTGTVYETRMAGFESLGSICSGGRYDSARQRRPHDLPRCGHLLRCDSHPGSAVRARAAPADPTDTDLRVGGRAGRGSAGSLPRGGGGPARSGHRDRGVAVGREVRQADPLRRAPRHPVRLVPGQCNAVRCRRGPRHPQRRPGPGRALLAAASR